MAARRAIAYWGCQAAGWFAWAAATVLVFALTDIGVTPRSVYWAVSGSALGFAISHVYRGIVRRHRWASRSLAAVAPRVVLAVLAQALVLDLCVVVNSWLMPDAAHPLRPVTAITFVFNFSIVFLGWSLIYFGLHWLERMRRAEQAQLRYLKSQLNPHFLFNALNSVRGLVAEDPARAQEAITRLANLLRVALGSVTADTVTLARELEVVNDYLALEAIRLEHRLSVTLDIAPDALAASVPAMLVQTLVENGIKHGVARRRDGGALAVSARVHGGVLELAVSNTAAPELGERGGGGGGGGGGGALGGGERDSGVGLANATERLQLLFGDRATLQLDRSSADRTIARARIPIA